MTQPDLGVQLISTDEEIQEFLSNYYPGLSLTSSAVIKGSLSFSMKIVGDKKIIFPSNQDRSWDRNNIHGKYNIRIDFDQKNKFPQVVDIDGVVKSRLELLSSKVDAISTIQDLHIYEDNTLCLCANTEFLHKYSKGITIEELIEDLVIPFFYYQEYLLQYYKEPYSGRSHGDMGLLEYLGENKNDKKLLNLTIGELNPKVLSFLKRRRMAGSRKCICGSGVKGKKCHAKAIRGGKIIFDYYEKNETNKN